jgi:hypothetical protein
MYQGVPLAFLAFYLVFSLIILQIKINSKEYRGYALAKFILFIVIIFL